MRVMDERGRESMITVAIAGDGQLGRGVAGVLESRADVRVIGPES